MSNIKLQAKCVLLDIEGTISDIRFVYDVMFPYAKKNMPSFLVENWESAAVQEAVRSVALDAKKTSAKDWLGALWKSTNSDALNTLWIHLQQLMETDSKARGLKMLQGMVWQFGFESGALRAELFPDVLPALELWKANGLDLRIYSSGSVLAQKMFFRYTVLGDLTDLFSAHYDTTVGTKREASSYEMIAVESHYDPTEIIFVTDVYAELAAANAADMQVVASIRPNNVPLPTEFTGLAITSFSQLELSSLDRLSDT